MNGLLIICNLLFLIPVKIKCRDLVKKIAIYKSRLAVSFWYSPPNTHTRTHTHYIYCVHIKNEKNKKLYRYHRTQCPSRSFGPEMAGVPWQRCNFLMQLSVIHNSYIAFPYFTRSSFLRRLSSTNCSGVMLQTCSIEYEIGFRKGLIALSWLCALVTWFCARYSSMHAQLELPLAHSPNAHVRISPVRVL